MDNRSLFAQTEDKSLFFQTIDHPSTSTQTGGKQNVSRYTENNADPEIDSYLPQYEPIYLSSEKQYAEEERDDVNPSINIKASYIRLQEHMEPWQSSDKVATPKKLVHETRRPADCTPTRISSSAMKYVNMRLSSRYAAGKINVSILGWIDAVGRFVLELTEGAYSEAIENVYEEYKTSKRRNCNLMEELKEAEDKCIKMILEIMISEHSREEKEIISMRMIEEEYDFSLKEIYDILRIDELLALKKYMYEVPYSIFNYPYMMMSG